MVTDILGKLIFLKIPGVSQSCRVLKGHIRRSFESEARWASVLDTKMCGFTEGGRVLTEGKHCCYWPLIVMGPILTFDPGCAADTGGLLRSTAEASLV